MRFADKAEAARFAGRHRYVARGEGDQPVLRAHRFQARAGDRLRDWDRRRCGRRCRSMMPTTTPSTSATTTIAITSGLFRRRSMRPPDARPAPAVPNRRDAQAPIRPPPAPGAGRGRDKRWPRYPRSNAPCRHQSQDLLLTLHAVADQVPNILLRVGHRRPVRRIIDAIVALPQLVEARHVGGHVAVGRDDHGRRPAHHMVAAEQGAAIGEAEMV